MNIDNALDKMLSGQKTKKVSKKQSFKFKKSMFHPRTNVPIKKADGKKLYYYDTTNVPSPKVLDKIYKKIPDNKNIPVVLETKKQYLNEYIKNQELVNGSPFSKEEKREYTQEELQNMKGVVSRYTTKKNKYIDPRVVFFTDRSWTPKELEFSAWHEYAHEKLENQPKLLDKYSQNFSPNKAVSQYGKEAGAEEDFADRYAMNHTQMRFDNISKDSLFRKVRENNKESVYRDPFKRKLIIKKEELHLLPGEEEQLVDSYSYLLDSSSPNLYKGNIYIKSKNPLIDKEFRQQLRDIKSVNPPKSIFSKTKIMNENDKENNREEDSNIMHPPYINRLRNKAGYINEYNPKDVEEFLEQSRKQQQQIQDARNSAFGKYERVGGHFSPTGKEKGITSFETDNFNLIKGTLHHEIGHHQGLKPFTKYTNYYDIFSIRTEPKNALTVYGKTDTEEDFAESFAKYLDNNYKNDEFVIPPKEAKIVRKDLMDGLFFDIKSGKSGREIEEEKLNPFELVKDVHAKDLGNITYAGGVDTGRNVMNPYTQASKIGINYIVPSEDNHSKDLKEDNYLNSYTTAEDIYNPYSSMPGFNYNMPELDKKSLNLAFYTSDAEKEGVKNKLYDFDKRIKEAKGQDLFKLESQKEEYINTLKFLGLDEPIKENKKPVGRPKIVIENTELTPEQKKLEYMRLYMQKYRETHPKIKKEKIVVKVPDVIEDEGSWGRVGNMGAKPVVFHEAPIVNEENEKKEYLYPKVHGQTKEIVFRMIKEQGDNGLTRSDMAKLTNIAPGTLNIELIRLKNEKKIDDSTERGHNKIFFLRGNNPALKDMFPSGTRVRVSKLEGARELESRPQHDESVGLKEDTSKNSVDDDYVNWLGFVGHNKSEPILTDEQIKQIQQKYREPKPGLSISQNRMLKNYYKMNELINKANTIMDENPKSKLAVNMLRKAKQIAKKDLRIERRHAAEAVRNEIKEKQALLEREKQAKINPNAFLDDEQVKKIEETLESQGRRGITSRNKSSLENEASDIQKELEMLKVLPIDKDNEEEVKTKITINNDRLNTISRLLKTIYDEEKEQEKEQDRIEAENKKKRIGEEIKQRKEVYWRNREKLEFLENYNKKQKAENDAIVTTLFAPIVLPYKLIKYISKKGQKTVPSEEKVNNNNISDNFIEKGYDLTEEQKLELNKKIRKLEDDTMNITSPHEYIKSRTEINKMKTILNEPLNMRDVEFEVSNYNDKLNSAYERVDRNKKRLGL